MNFLWWYGVYIFSLSFLLSVLSYYRDTCIFHLSFSFWCHAWMHTFFLRGCFNAIISRLSPVSFIRDPYWFFKICFWVYFFLVSSHPHLPCFSRNICHWKFTSNLGCGCEYRDENVCKKKAFTSIQDSFRHAHKRWNR